MKRRVTVLVVLRRTTSYRYGVAYLPDVVPAPKGRYDVRRRRCADMNKPSYPVRRPAWS